ncbi:MAG TPA: hypothetical protein VM120_10435 [Bryobacteraceae bacterium]|nr:hypothetical protein [Bryobacteraceae bacterium]
MRVERVENHKGKIQVSTWDRAEVDIPARITAEPSWVVDRSRIDATGVIIDSTADSLRIKTKYAPNNHWCCGTTPEVHYTIRMPKNARLAICDHRSELEIASRHTAASGRVTGLGGPLTLDTHRRGIQVQFFSFQVNSRITTHRGSSDLAMPRGSRFEACHP